MGVEANILASEVKHIELTLYSSTRYVRGGGLV